MSDRRVLVVPTTLEPVKTLQIYEKVCVQIIRTIGDGVWLPGQKLPSERALAETLEVSRPTIREAIAALNTHGVIETKPGAGSYVSSTSPDELALVLERFGEEVKPIASSNASGLELEFPTNLSPVSLLEVREVVEPAIAGIAAQRYGAEEDHLEEYRLIMDGAFEMGNQEDRAAWSEADRMFHREFAIVTGNPVFIAVANLIANVMDQKLWHRIRDDALQRPGVLEQHAEQHQRILDAVESGDSELSALLARRHVVGVRENLDLAN